jgi:hypothetical protein
VLGLDALQRLAEPRLALDDHRLQPRRGGADVEGCQRVAVEQRALQLASGGGERRAELGRGRQLACLVLDDRLEAQQRRLVVDQPDRQAIGDLLVDLVGGQRADRALRERVGVEDRHARVDRQAAEHEAGRRQREQHARADPEPRPFSHEESA